MNPWKTGDHVMERKVKEEIRTRDPKKAWERLQAVLVNDDDMTIEELDEELRECGINPQDSVKRIFEIARRVCHETNTDGRVSPHVSEILSQLAVKYYELEDQTVEKVEPTRALRKTASNKSRVARPEANKARSKVLSYHRNYRDESANDRSIRERNEELLLEKAEKLKQKKVSRKK
jgi:hypothetical protein